jgi:2-phosphoglycerate kinase
MVQFLQTFLFFTIIVLLEVSLSHSYAFSANKRFSLKPKTCSIQRILTTAEFSRLNALESSKDKNGETEKIGAFDELRSKLRGTCIYLVGMMGSGKSTTGKLLSEKLGYRFLDTDEIAEYMIEMPISEYFAQGNEAQFRELEYKILMEVSRLVFM